MRHFLLIIASSVICFFPLVGEIVKTNEIGQILPEIDENTLVLFNLAEVCLDTGSSLGTQAWRKYVRSRVDSKLHDELTLYVFQQVPPKTPEESTAEVIAQLQQKGIAVFGFTSRGRHEWYGTQVADVDMMTENLLRQLDIDFSRTHIPLSVSNIYEVFGEFFHEGIIYATNAFDKGEMLLKFLDAAPYHPSKVIFVDDKADSLTSVGLALKERGIPFTGFAYSRTSLEHAHFDPMIAHIQLDWLMSHGECLSDEEASHMKPLLDPQLTHEDYFLQILGKWKSSSTR